MSLFFPEDICLPILCPCIIFREKLRASVCSFLLVMYFYYFTLQLVITNFLEKAELRRNMILNFTDEHC